MSSYKNHIISIKKDLIESYFEDLNSKEENREIELKAAIIFQKYARRLICRKRFLILKAEALEVQKAFRGYLARANHQQEVAEQNDNIMTEFYKYQVIIIQRIEKGINVEKMLWIIMLIENG